MKRLETTRKKGCQKGKHRGEGEGRAQLNEDLTATKKKKGYRKKIQRPWRKSKKKKKTQWWKSPEELLEKWWGRERIVSEKAKCGAKGKKELRCEKKKEKGKGPKRNVGWQFAEVQVEGSGTNQGK